MKQKKLIFVSILLAVVIIVGAALYRVRAHADGLPFGGFITSTFFCSCDGGWLLTVGPPVGGTFVYRNTPQYAYSQLPRSGVWVLGLYEPGAECAVFAGHHCDFIPATGTITPIVGTSL